MNTRSITFLLTFAIVALIVWWWPVGTPATPETHFISIDATQFAFAPGRLHVNHGDRVVINVTASDVVHGFHLDDYGLETRIEPGITQQIAFVADHPGKFRYRCSVSCGPLHPFMIGELVVHPNNPFWKSVAIALIAVAGMLTYLWKFGQKGKY